MLEGKIVYINGRWYLSGEKKVALQPERCCEIKFEGEKWEPCSMSIKGSNLVLSGNVVITPELASWLDAVFRQREDTNLFDKF